MFSDEAAEYPALTIQADPTGTIGAGASINATIAQLPAGGGRILFPPGTFLIDQTIIINQDNVEFLGSGWSTILKAAPTLTGFMLQVQGPGGAGNFRYGIRIADIFFNGNSVAGVSGIDLVSTYACVVEHVRIRFVAVNSITFDGIGGAFGAYNYLLNCHITDGSLTSSIGLITNNSEWLTIEGCQFGFFFGGTAVGCLIQNQNCKLIGVSFDRNDRAIQISFTNRTVVSGCQFDRGLTNFIYLQSGKNNVVQGNVFNTSTGGVDLIRADGVNNDKNIISNNSCTAGGWTNFVNEIAGIGGINTYSNNDIAGYAVIRQTGRFSGNDTYNPIGQVVAPAFPATTVNVTNTTGSWVTAYIANGTGAITQIQTAGQGGVFVTTGYQIPASGFGAVRIGPNGGVNFTYAAGTPTWTWFGD